MMNSFVNQNPIVGFLLRCRYALVAVAILSAVGAYAAADKFSSKSWSCTATLLYNRSVLGEPHYRQPEAASIVSLFKSRAALEKIAREFNLPAALKPLADSIQAEILFNSNTIQLTLRGSDLQQTQAILDRLVQVVIEQAAQLRREALTNIVADRRKNLAAAKAEAEAALAALDRFHAAQRIVLDVPSDLERIRDDIATVERAAETDLPSTLDPHEALQRRRGVLQEHLTMQRDAIARESALTLKRHEYERAVRLHDKQYISDAEFRRVESEYRSLEAQNTAALQDFQQKLAQIDQTLANRMEAKKPPTDGTPPPGVAADADPIAALAARTEAFLANRKAEAERLNALRAEDADLKQAVLNAQSEVNRLSTLITTFNEMLNAEFDDLTIVQRAAPALDPAVSNKKKVLAGSFIALLGLLLTPLLVWDVFRQSRKSATPGVAVTATPHSVLNTVPTTSTKHGISHHEVVRTLALRIQQLPVRSGAVILFNRLDELAPPVDAVLDVAECLHRRGEKVLVLDASGNPAAVEALQRRTSTSPVAHPDIVDTWIGGNAARAHKTTQIGGRDLHGTAVAVAPRDGGLAEWLSDESFALDDVVRRGETFDALTLGNLPMPEEAFAGRRMSSMFDELRRRYGEVLILGPNVDHQVDLELLAARADALALISTAGKPPLPAAERTIAQLVALKAPVLGRFEL